MDVLGFDTGRQSRVADCVVELKDNSINKASISIDGTRMKWKI
jgi:hypothetical protein